MKRKHLKAVKWLKLGHELVCVVRRGDPGYLSFTSNHLNLLKNVDFLLYKPSATVPAFEYKQQPWTALTSWTCSTCPSLLLAPALQMYLKNFFPFKLMWSSTVYTDRWVVARETYKFASERNTRHFPLIVIVLKLVTCVLSSSTTNTSHSRCGHYLCELVL